MWFAKQFDMILKGRVLREMTPAGTMSADTMKPRWSQIGRQASRWSKAQTQRNAGLPMRCARFNRRSAAR